MSRVTTWSALIIYLILSLASNGTSVAAKPSPTTDEIGHAAGLDVSHGYLYISDGSPGVSAWNLLDPLGYPTDSVHLVANTLQNEYPELVNGEPIYPPSHTVRSILDLSRGTTWAMCVGNSMRRVPVGVDPTDIFLKNLEGTVIHGYRPTAVSQFKFQYVPGYETVDGGAVKLDYTNLNGRLHFYEAFGTAGLLKIDYSNPAAPMLMSRTDTAGEASDVVISNGRLYLADGASGLVFFR